jgi:hypothetical protein
MLRILDGFGGQGEQARSRRRTADKRPQNAHHGSANDVSVHQSEDRDPRHRILANIGSEQRIAGSGKGRDRREFKNQMRCGVGRPGERHSQPFHATESQGFGLVGADRLDESGLNGLARRARIQRCPRPTQSKLDKAFRQQRKESDRSSPPKQAEQALLRLRIGCRIG